MYSGLGMSSQTTHVGALLTQSHTSHKLVCRSVVKEVEDLRSRLKQSEEEKRMFETKYLQAQVPPSRPRQSMCMVKMMHCLEPLVPSPFASTLRLLGVAGSNLATRAATAATIQRISTGCISLFSKLYTHTHVRIRTNTHTRTRARAHTHTHTHAMSHTFLHFIECP